MKRIRIKYTVIPDGRQFVLARRIGSEEKVILSAGGYPIKYDSASRAAAAAGTEQERDIEAAHRLGFEVDHPLPTLRKMLNNTRRNSDTESPTS